MEEDMKKLFAVILMLLFLSGCGAAARKSEFYEHDTMYRNGDHLLFSIYEYKKVDSKDVRQSETEKWWGIPVELSK
ncbi:MAG: hypothetical protein C0390_02350 [Syntrophus sp. (in: bacteria)]|nr:hypothetical protein [Syntrophus sp. (in: bacteria)]